MAVSLITPNGHKISLNTGLFINNTFVQAKSGQTIVSIDPTTEKEITTVQAAGPEDIDDAVHAARNAFNSPEWRDMDPTERGNLLRKLADLIEAGKEVFASLETWDGGKPYTAALEEDVAEVINVFRYYAGWADKLHGQTIPIPSKLVYTVRQPVGVCGQIIPWNYPLDMLAWKLGPALCCGNTVIMKPAEQTPISALYFAGLVAKAGFPPGVINIVNGYGAAAGNAIVTHPGIDKIAFTGSTATGKQIQKAASINMKNITLETGGKSPLIIFDDANLEQASKWAHIGIMSNQGQICSATSRIFVQENVLDKVVDKLTKVTKETSIVGDPFDVKTFQGPQVTKAQYDRVMAYIQSGRNEGASCVFGGSPNVDAGKGKGFFINPTIFTKVKPSMKIYREEVFGPLVTVVAFKTEEEVIALANDTEYGLGAAVFSENIAKAHRVASRIDAGTVWVNSSNDGDFRAPFGGFKQSGIGRELGEAGLHGYTQIKTIHVNLGNEL
ncbi:hypothetical protein ACHAPT_006437 [Fusarium lateritium]